MRILALFLPVLLAGATTAPARAQGPAESVRAFDREREVLETVEHVLALLGGLRFYALPQYFTEDANIATARKTKSLFVNRVVSARAWIESMAQGPAPRPFEEVLSNVEVTVDSGELALVRADFEIVREGRVESRGVDLFTLLRQDGVWKISSIAYTSIPEALSEGDRP